MDDWWRAEQTSDGYTYNYQYCQDNAMLQVPAQCIPRRYYQNTGSLSDPAQCYQQSQNNNEQMLPCTSRLLPKGENPRETRNKAEKQRRDKMNQSISKLASIVPPVVASGRKMDKTSVLRLTAHYLRSHQYVFGDSLHGHSEFTAGFMQALLKMLNGFLITTTYKGLIVVVSPNINEYLGYTELQLLGQNIFNIIHNDDHTILRKQLMPTASLLGRNGELLLPIGANEQRKMADMLARDKRIFNIRFKKLSQRRSEPSEYVTCHIEGTLRISDKASPRNSLYTVRRTRSRSNHTFSSGNDVVFIGLVRPKVETFISESAMEEYRMEYRTRHSVDGEIIQCEHRIAMVTGYMMHEVNGVNAMNFMHKDDVQWVIIALRQMYDHNQLVGESCYRLMTKNGRFIYLKTCGCLDVDPDSKAVTSFVCTNTLVGEQEGQLLIQQMKRKLALALDNNEEINSDDGHVKGNDRQLLIENPSSLEKKILSLVTNLTPSKLESSETEHKTSQLAFVPPRPERIVSAIKKSCKVIKNLKEPEEIVKPNKVKKMAEFTEENEKDHAELDYEPEITEENLMELDYEIPQPSYHQPTEQNMQILNIEETPVSLSIEMTATNVVPLTENMEEVLTESELNNSTDNNSEYNFEYSITANAYPLFSATCSDTPAMSSLYSSTEINTNEPPKEATNDTPYRNTSYEQNMENFMIEFNIPKILSPANINQTPRSICLEFPHIAHKFKTNFNSEIQGLTLNEAAPSTSGINQLKPKNLIGDLHKNNSEDDYPIDSETLNGSDPVDDLILEYDSFYDQIFKSLLRDCAKVAIQDGIKCRNVANNMVNRPLDFEDIDEEETALLEDLISIDSMDDIEGYEDVEDLESEDDVGQDSSDLK